MSIYNSRKGPNDIINVLDQRLANYDPWAKSSLLHVL